MPFGSQGSELTVRYTLVYFPIICLGREGLRGLVRKSNVITCIVETFNSVGIKGTR